MKDLNPISGTIVDAAFLIHRTLEPHFLESVDEIVAAHELEKRCLKVEHQKAVSITYDGLGFEEGFRADLIIEKSVVVELKLVEQLSPVQSKQLLTYLRLLDYRLGLLINFGAPGIKDGIRRIVNRL